VVLFFTYGNLFLGFVKLLVVGYSGGVLTMHLHSHCFTITQVFLAPYFLITTIVFPFFCVVFITIYTIYISVFYSCCGSCFIYNLTMAVVVGRNMS